MAAAQHCVQLTGLISARVRRCSPIGVWFRGPGKLPATARQLTRGIERGAALSYAAKRRITLLAFCHQIRQTTPSLVLLFQLMRRQALGEQGFRSCCAA
jgi:hypothetical protein